MTTRPAIDCENRIELIDAFLWSLRPRRPERCSFGLLKSLLLSFIVCSGLIAGILSWAGWTKGALSVASPRPHTIQPSFQISAPRRSKTVKPATKVKGLLQFRGNAARNYYGQGPMPVRPKVLWRYPNEPMCSVSSVGKEVSTWCGTGWTGQPVVWERLDGVTEVIFGAYDGQVHFVDAHTGKPTRQAFATDDIVKGSVSLDPDGDPLLYFGSRDDHLRIVALDRDHPVELWSLNASFVKGLWNNDWDSNPTLHRDVLFSGGENGYFFGVKLNRDYDAQGRVTVDPEMLVAIRGWTKELLAAVGDRNVSIENSVTLFGDRAYFGNSAGRIVGLDISRVEEGIAPVVFDFWVGDDVDASIVVDEQGMLYVAVELERFLPRSDEMGQLIKINPYLSSQNVVWSIQIPPSFADYRGGIWATPALAKGILFVATHPGQLLAVDKNSGQVTFVDEIGPHAWSSPIVVDDFLLVANCRGQLRCYSIAEPSYPKMEWSVHIPTKACIESTPAVWKGRIFVGSRDGYVYAFGRPEPSKTPSAKRLLRPNKKPRTKKKRFADSVTRTRRRLLARQIRLRSGKEASPGGSHYLRKSDSE